MDDGEIYKHLDDLYTKVTDAVCRQTELLMESSKEYQTANEVGNLYKVGAIGNICSVCRPAELFSMLWFMCEV
ncbi:hypothetical protein RASY3_13345 [Ruminococcus albus SY3]|uniref:Uncharacterized protein n=1 Tax=Ruminococcus albus SY3 TaxID=1341156 RepID=A0A011VT45_RUMAL|nr:hypothetical protein [Ruminococcus albus]EXM38436.1 hypothetical protein RASY3_13345 [Ruminococcus albus SY3]